MKIFIIIFISLFITKGYANNMEISGIDISQFNEGFNPKIAFMIMLIITGYQKQKYQMIR